MEPAAVAEDAFGYVVTSPGEQREAWSNVILTHGPTPIPEFGSASRIRFQPDADADVARVRAWFAARSRDEFVWSIGPSSMPTDLEHRLCAHGARPSPLGSDAMAMVLDHEPLGAPADIEVRRVESQSDYAAMWEINFEAFGMPEAERRAVRSTIPDRWTATRASGERWSYLALIGGVPVGQGSVRRTVHGPLWLAGGATLPEFRGRGIYHALVRARWSDAVRLGSAALVVQAMVDSSYPILERIGFRPVGRMRILVDTSR